MTFNKAIICGIDLTDAYRSPQPYHLFAEVVLLDKSHEGLNPFLYELKHSNISEYDNIAAMQPDLANIGREDYLILGEVESILKDKRQILLTNKNLISYKYLIIATGNKHTLVSQNNDQEFSGGLHALLKGLAIQKKVKEMLERIMLPTDIIVPTGNEKNYTTRTDTLDIATANITQKRDPLPSVLSSGSKRIFLVHMGNTGNL